MTIELDDNSAELLEELKRQAAARAMSFSAYLRFLIDSNNHLRPAEHLSDEEFSRLLRELPLDETPVGSLPDDFSRADIYAEHD